MVVCVCAVITHCWGNGEYGINPSSTQSSSLCGRSCPAETGTGGHVSLHHNQITATAHVYGWTILCWCVDDSTLANKGESETEQNNLPCVHAYILPTGLDNEATLNQCQLNWWHMTKRFQNYFLVAVFCTRIFIQRHHRDGSHKNEFCHLLAIKICH